MKHCELTIIVPHYNTPDSLLKLLNNIPVREDIEVIVVDDNSNVSLDELEKQIKNFPMVQLLVNDSGVKGAGASRNIALRQAAGQWILFADADDFFTDNWFQEVSGYFNSEYDMVYFPPTSMDVVTGGGYRPGMSCIWNWSKTIESTPLLSI